MFNSSVKKTTTININYTFTDFYNDWWKTTFKWYIIPFKGPRVSELGIDGSGLSVKQKNAFFVN